MTGYGGLALVGRVVAALTATAAAMIALACGGEAAPARTALTPIANVEVPNPVDLGAVASSAAIETARQIVLSAGVQLGAASMPADPVSRLTTAGALSTWATERQPVDADYTQVPADTLVWAVQLEGRWRPVSSTTNQKVSRFAIVAIDARTGDAVAGAVSPDPFIAPKRLRDKNTFDCVVFEPAEGRLAIGPRQAVDSVRATYAAGATNKFGAEWDFDRADAETVRCVDTASGIDTFRFRWFVTVPSAMALKDCSTPSTRDVDLKRRCWSPIAVHLVDGLTGEIRNRREIEFTGPLLTDREFDDVTRFAASAGWWEAWARLNAFNDSIVPSPVISSLTSP